MKKVIFAIWVLAMAVYLYLDKLSGKRTLAADTELSSGKQEAIGSVFDSAGNGHGSSRLETNHEEPEQSVAVSRTQTACLPDMSFDQEEYSLQAEAYVNSLAESGNIEDKLLYALFASKEERENSTNISMLDNVESLDPVFALNAIASCSSGDNQNCTNQLLNKAAEYDIHNGATWFYKAIAHARLKDNAAVLASLSEMSKTSFFNERIGEQALLYAEALNGSEANRFVENALTGFEKASNNSPNYRPITEWCDENSENQQIIMACLSLGKELSSRSHVLLTKLIGFALQKKAYVLLNEDKSVEETNNNVDAIRANAKVIFNEKLLQMIMSDERLIRRWLTLLDNYGEQNTLKRLAAEAIELFGEGEYLPCL